MPIKRGKLILGPPKSARSKNKQPPPYRAAKLEREIQETRFEQSPVEIILKFLDSYERKGQVERYVLDALASRLRAFISQKGLTLDLAFGGKVGRQLQAAMTARKADEITREVMFARVGGVPHGKAIAAAAKKHNLSVERVRDLYKLAGPKGPRARRGGNSRQLHGATKKT
jgi:hypothetical protein